VRLAPPLEELPDGSYRSVLVDPGIPAGAGRDAIIAAAGRGEDLDEDVARHVRVTEYDVPGRDGNGGNERIVLVTTTGDWQSPGPRPGRGIVRRAVGPAFPLTASGHSCTRS
jgi:hypothetical protein